MCSVWYPNKRFDVAKALFELASYRTFDFYEQNERIVIYLYITNIISLISLPLTYNFHQT